MSRATIYLGVDSSVELTNADKEVLCLGYFINPPIIGQHVVDLQCQ